MDKLDSLPWVGRYYAPHQTPLVGDEDLVARLAEFAFCGRGVEPPDAGLAAKIGYSTTHLRRICLSATGEPVGSFLRRARLERAAGRLVLESSRIQEISEEAGYLSEEAFSKAFCRHFDCSPTGFRRLNRSTRCLMPGYLCSNGGLRHLPRTVHVITGFGQTTTFLFDGPILLARILPDGAFDWMRPGF